MRGGRPPGRPARAEPDAPGLPARRAALEAVAGALSRRASLDEAAEGPDLPAADAALARAIAASAFRRFGTIRDALGRRMSRGLPDDPRAIALLATGAAQILFLDVPDHAAVDLSVRLASGDGRTAHLAGLVNAVLRRLARERDAVLAAAEAAPLLDLPAWLRTRWIGSYGPDRTVALAAAIRAGAPLDLTVKDDPAGWAERLGGEVLATGSVRVEAKGAVEALSGYQEGAWWVQDAAAALPARLLRVGPGGRVLDLCAAPGGKTAQLAAARAHVVALDRSGPRLRRLAANMARLGLQVETVEADALAYRADPFDAVLLDAPCTGTGTLRRHPDIGWSKDERDLASLLPLQAALLDRAADLVRPGGRLVYCVCSLEPEEGEDQAAALLARRPDLAREPVDPAELGLGPGFVTGEGDLRTAPDLWPPTPRSRGGLDGFFAARFVRRGGGATAGQQG